MRVDLPAPFSPIRAWISPRSTRRSTLSSATTPGNSLPMPRMRSSSWLIAYTASRQLRLGVVAAVDQHFLVVVLVDGDGLQQVRGHDLLAVVVAFGVVDLRLLALEDRIGHVHRGLRALARVLDDGLGLRAGVDRLDRGEFGVLAGDDGKRPVAASVSHGFQRGDDADADAVVGRKYRVDLLLGVVRADQVVHAGL